MKGMILNYYDVKGMILNYYDQIWAIPAENTILPSKHDTGP